MIYHRNVQPLVAYLETLHDRFTDKGFTMTLSPSGQGTTGGSLGVTMTASSPSDEHTLGVEDAGAMDRYVTITVDGRVVSIDDNRPGKIHYGPDLVTFMREHIDKFIDVVSDAA